MNKNVIVCYVKGCRLCVDETCIASPLIIGKDGKCMTLEFSMDWFKTDLKEKVSNESPDKNGRVGATQVGGK